MVDKVNIMFTDYRTSQNTACGHWFESIPVTEIKKRAEQYRVSECYEPCVDLEYKGFVTLTINIDSRGVRYRIW